MSTLSDDLVVHRPGEAACQLVPPDTALHFIQGEQDPVIAPAFSLAAVERLRELGGNAALDLLPGLGHGTDSRVLALLDAALDPCAASV